MAYPRTPGAAKKKAQTKTADIAVARNATYTNNMASAASVSADKPLTDKQKAFVQFWAEGDSMLNAYTRAGYSIKQASYAFRMAKMPNILALKNKYAEEYRAATHLKKKDVIQGIKDAIDMAKLMSEPQSMISGWREIGKLLGYYEPKKVDLTVSVNGTIQVERMNKMTDAELLEIISKGAGDEMMALAHDCTA